MSCTIIEYERPEVIRKYKKQVAFIDSPTKHAIVEATSKAGKAQPLDAIIKTPEGDRLMMNLAIGDEVFTPFGVSTVAEIHPQGLQDVYRVTFSDRSYTECTKDHLWEIHSFKQYYGRGRHKGRPEDITQATRKDKIGWPRLLTLEQVMKFSQKRWRKLFIPQTSPVFYPDRELKIPPYLMGVLLGDGGFTTDTVSLSSDDREILERVTPMLPPGHEFRKKSKKSSCDYHITAGAAAKRLSMENKTMMAQLRHYGLAHLDCKQKFIPEDYKYNSLEVRKEVLRGIFDTDGFVNEHGQINIELTGRLLVDGIQEIIEGMGGVVKRTDKANRYRGKDGEWIPAARVYRMTIMIDDHDDLFTLSRKKKLCKKKVKPIRRNIKSIEYVGQKPCQCICLDDDKGLYLTDNFIVTHNTVAMLVWIYEQALADIPGRESKDGCYYWWVAPVSSVALIAFRRMKRFIHPKELFTSNETEHSITLINGACIQFKSADKPDSLYGEDVYAAVLDESTRMKEDAYIAVDSTLTATEGALRIIGNVKGTNNWSYKLAREVELGKLSSWSYFKLTAGDAVEAGVLKQDILDEKRSRLPYGVFMELYYAIPFVNSSNKFAYAYDGAKHIKSCSVNYSYPIYLSFDFNRNPISCSVIQYYDEIIKIPFTIKLVNSDIYKLCEYIKNKFSPPGKNPHFIVNGDASGRASSAMVKDNLNYFRIIKSELGLATSQMQQLAVNPKIEENQVLVNAVLEHVEHHIDPDGASALIFDLEFAEMLPDGTLKKGDRNDPAQQLDILDSYRYYINRNMRHFLKGYR